MTLIVDKTSLGINANYELVGVILCCAYPILVVMKNLDPILPISDEGLYPIRTVSEVSGVNSITLRAWERRYDLFKPKRTPKGHRLYSDKDIQCIHQVLALLAKGVSIGRVAKALKESQGETQSPSLLSVKADDAKVKEPTKEQWDEHQNDLLSKISNYDIAHLESFHHNLLSSNTIESVSKYLILPVLKTLDKRAQQLQSLAGEYHFYKVFILHIIGSIFLKSSIQNVGKKILVMGVTSQDCDVELLLFSMPLLQRGYQVVILGCDMSLDAMPMSLSASNADALLLYSDLKGLSEITATEFQVAVSSLNKPVFLSGQYSKDQEKQLGQSGLVLLPQYTEKQFHIIDRNINKATKLNDT